MMRFAFNPRALWLAALLATVVALQAPAGRAAEDTWCPNGGVVRMGAIPAEDAAAMLPVFQPFADAISARLGCKVELFVGTSYNANIEAMRSKRIEIGTFGGLSYVLAHQVANAQAFAVEANKAGEAFHDWASIVTPKSTGITTLKQVAGHSFAYADPDSTSGHLFPAYALKSAGIDPDTGIRPYYAGNHAASWEALRNHKVDVGELDRFTTRIAMAKGEIDPNDYVTLWKSAPLPGGPMAIRGDLPESFKERVRKAVYAVDLSNIPDPNKILNGVRWVPVSDSDYNQVRAVVSTLHIDLTKVGQ